MTADRQQELPTFLLARSLALSLGSACPAAATAVSPPRNSAQPDVFNQEGAALITLVSRLPSSGRRGRASSVMRPHVRQDEALLLLPAQPVAAAYVNHTCSRCKGRIQWAVEGGREGGPWVGGVVGGTSHVG